MSECALVRVGLLVKALSTPRSNGDRGRSCSVTLKCQPEMANLIIKVSDHDNDGSGEDSDHFESSKSGSGKSQHKYRTLERVDSGSNGGGGAGARGSSRSTVKNRPSCRKARSESQLANGNVRNNLNSRDNLTSGVSSTSPVYRSCDYYRQKFLQDSLNQPSDLSDWINFSNVHKIAGQKVVEKLAAQQRALEADAELHKKKSSPTGSGGSHHSNSEPDSSAAPKNYSGFLPIKKKPGRLDPLPLKPIKLKN